MAKSNLGKTVSRVGSSGGGSTYKKARPMNFYMVIGIIVVVGLAAIVWSRHERQQSAAALTVYPQVGATGFAGLASQECGTVLPYFKEVGDSTGTYHIQIYNVLKIAPTVQSQAGTNATLNAFITQTPGFFFSKQKVSFPGPSGKATAATTYTAGDKCAPGTKYAGQTAYPVVSYWTNNAQSTPVSTIDPSTVQFKPSILITIAFEPKGILPTRPSSQTYSAVIAAENAVAASTTTTSTTTTTTVP